MPAITPPENLSQPVYVCTTCGRSNPYLEAHVCQLTERNRRRFEESQRSRSPVGTVPPSDCQDCGRPMPGPGEGAHACAGPPAPASMPGPIDQLAGELRRAGYKIIRETKP